MNAKLSIFREFPETKMQVKSFAEGLISSIVWGDINPLELDGRLKALEEMIEFVRKSEELQNSLIVEAEKYGANTFDSGKFKHQIKEVGIIYNFDSCDDEKLIELENKAEKIAEDIKFRKNFLKSILPNETVFDENGIRLYPPAKKSTTKVITILK
jgi:hypothetical protein